MELEVKKKLRRATRSQFTRVINQTGQLEKPEDIQLNMSLLSELSTKLDGLDQDILILMGDAEEADLEKELDEVMSYKKKWYNLKQSVTIDPDRSLEKSNNLKKAVRSASKDRKFKLPILETKQFDGNVKNWIPFWGQFEKIHKDPNIDDTDKFQYLIQAMAPGTEVRNFIESYPLSSKTYHQALSDLKQRYAREDLLIQVYVRELLNMITNKNAQNLTYLFDNLSSHLRALETLGVTQDGYSSFLLPMVESTLPIDTLRAWERARPDETKDVLKSLLEFLKKEVESEQRIKMATGFTTDNIKMNEKEKEATAAILVDRVAKPERKNSCLWCEKEHSSVECYRLSKMTIEERKDQIKKKNACMLCLKTGHHAKTCKAFVKCFICKKKHSVAFCPGLSNSDMISKDKNPLVSETTNNLSSQESSVTLLQTIMVKLVSGKKEVMVRALIDNGSQRSYLKKDVAQKLGIPNSGREVLTHNLFSGVEVKSKEHNIYNISVQSCDDQSYSFNIAALEQPIICNSLPRYNDDNFDVTVRSLLVKHGIKLTDSDKNNITDISLLIGADYSGYIMTNTMIELKEGLLAIKTKLGWVLQGKVNNAKSNTTNTLFCSSDITGFWSLELLGIRDPVENKTKVQAEADAVMSFEKSVSVNTEGRYEVALPFKVGHEDLQSNRGIAEKRLVSSTKCLKSSGSLNWSDVASRGCNAEQLLALRWWEGPVWLRLSSEEWPKSTINIDNTEACKEIKKTKASCNINISVKEIIDMLCYFSKYTKIVRMMAWILRFVKNMQSKDIKIKGEITVEEYEKAEKKIIKLIQGSEEEYLKEQKRSLSTYLDEEGLIRVKTKLLLSDFPESTKSPVLLPGKNIIVRRLVEQRHRALHHAGANQVTADIRTRFWIIGIRRLTKSVIAACTICTRFRAKPVQAPTAPLPNERIQCTAPFQVSGADLAGPMFLRNGDKCWIVLYTCAVYRCVHLELTKSLSTEAFMLTLRRFIARRGRITQIICDNGTNLTGTKNRLAEVDWDEVQKRSAIERIKFKMNAPTASWWGGFFERLIRIMKELLRRILGQSCVDYEELQTILCECEAVMNQRPLTYVQDDKNTHLEPLTPSRFIQCIPHNDVTDLDAADAKALNSRLKFLVKLREDFKQRFKTEYLTSLVQRGKDIQNKLAIGDIVLIETEEKRVKWPLGVITEIYVGKDGINRTAKLKTALGSKVRPFQKLYPLEVSSEEVNNQLQSYSQDLPSQSSDIDMPIKDERKQEEECITSKTFSERTTRFGRAVRMPSKYNL